MKTKLILAVLLAALVCAAPAVAHDETPYGTTFCGSYPGDHGSYWQSPYTHRWWRDWWTGHQTPGYPTPVNTSGYNRWDLYRLIGHDLYDNGWRFSHFTWRFCGLVDLPAGQTPPSF